MIRLLSGGFSKPRLTSSGGEAAGGVSAESSGMRIADNNIHSSVVEKLGKRTRRADFILQPLLDTNLSDLMPPV
jgi:hypothetical protein